METYARGIPTYKGENGQTIGLLCETKEQCITDDNGVRLSDKLQSMQEQIGVAPDFTGYATETYVDNSVSGLATEEYVDASVSSLATKAYVDSSVDGLAKTEYVDKAVTDMATTSYVDGKVNDLASKTYVDTAVSDKATTAYVDAAVSNAGGGGDADTLDGHHASYFAPTDIVTDIVNGTIQVGRTMIADRAITADVATSATQATTDSNGNNIVATYLPKSVVVITNYDPGVGAYVSYENGTLLFVKGA